MKITTGSIPYIIGTVQLSICLVQNFTPKNNDQPIFFSIS